MEDDWKSLWVGSPINKVVTLFRNSGLRVNATAFWSEADSLSIDLRRRELNKYGANKRRSGRQGREAGRW